MSVQESKKSKSRNKEASFEEMFSELKEIAGKLSMGNVSLDEMIQDYEKAMIIYKKCNEKLTAASMKVQEIESESSI